MKYFWLLIANLLLVSPGSANQIFTDWEIERTQSTFSTKGFSKIELVNEYGNIRTRGTTDSQLTVISINQHHKKDSSRPKVVLVKDGDRLMLKIDYPLLDDLEVLRDAKKRRVDISVLVPNRSNLNVRTVFGLAEVKGHKAPMSISTISGDIYAKTKSVLNAMSTHGNIHATFKQKSWQEKSSLSSKTGDIRVVLPGSPDMKVFVSTAGMISTDYSIAITDKPGSRHKNALVKIGKGGEELAIKSLNGDVVLFKMVEMLDAN